MNTASPPSPGITGLPGFLAVKPEARERFRKMLFEIAEHLAMEPDFVSASVHEDMDAPDTVVLHETWIGSREHLLRTNLSKPYRKECEAALPQMLKSDRRIVLLRPPLASYSKA